jgi:hypothetical protein
VRRAISPSSRFSLVLGFLGHILCSFVGGVCIYLCFLFFSFELFHTFFKKKTGNKEYAI